MSQATVATPTEAVKAMLDHFELPRTLMGGTRAMRKASKKYLPQEAAESDEAYKNRLERSFLYNAFLHAVRNLSGKILGKKGLDIQEKTPDAIKVVCDDIDLHGRDLSAFIHDVVEDTMSVGVSHILIDHPTVKGSNALSVAEEQENGIRPYLVHYRAEQVIGWKVRRVGSKDQLVQLRLLEVVVEPDGEWGETSIEQIRVLEPGRWTIYRLASTDKNKTVQWVIYDQGESSIKDEIPFVSFYARRTGFMQALPPLEDLAYVNVAHWQSASDQRHIVHVARVPILFGTGLDEDQGKLEIGANRLLKAPSGATLAFVEHTGSAIRAGQVDLTQLEDKMAILALEPVLQDRPGTQTATARALDTAEAQSVLQNITDTIKDSIDLVFYYLGLWLKVDGDAGGVILEADDPASLVDSVGLQELGKARTAGDISRTAYLTELKRRNILNKDYDIEGDKNILDQEIPPMKLQKKETLPTPPVAPKNA
jgi:hypothetical protein